MPRRPLNFPTALSLMLCLAAAGCRSSGTHTLQVQVRVPADSPLPNGTSIALVTGDLSLSVTVPPAGGVVDGAYRVYALDSSVNAGARAGIVLRPPRGAGPAEVFVVPACVLRAAEWTEWRAPSYLDDPETAESRFMDAARLPRPTRPSSPTRAEVRYKCEAAEGQD